MFSSLMKSRRFAPLFWCQFLSAFNDNLVRNALVILITYKLATSNGDTLVALAGTALVAPFFFLSGLAGEMADKFDKSRMAERLKFYEIAIAAIAAFGFLLQSVSLLFVALAGYGIIAALFGPIKYGVLPVHLDVKELPAGNALIESATFARHPARRGHRRLVCLPHGRRAHSLDPGHGSCGLELDLRRR